MLKLCKPLKIILIWSIVCLSSDALPDGMKHPLASANSHIRPSNSNEGGPGDLLNLTVTNTANTMGVNVKGYKMHTLSGTEIYAFQGIRYAEHPKERFQPPIELPENYYSQENVTELEAVHLPEKCAQRGTISSLAVGVEDCLFLNVYTKQLSNSFGVFLNKHPVMLFIHGGGFVWGDTSIYMPTRLLEKDVVLVTIQYRLGSFGFFSTGEPDAPGNAGLYDQQMAIKWTHKYISDFGGDPEKITIFGQSAGGASVSYHLLEYESNQYLQGVIAESGNALEYWAIDEDPQASARAIAEINGCSDTESMTSILKCMKRLPMEQLVAGIAALSQQDIQEAKSLGFRGASPIIQDFLVGVEDDDLLPIVSKTPQEYFMDRRRRKPSLMIGANRDEGTFPFGIMYVNYLTKNGYDENPLYLKEQMIPDLLNTIGIADPNHYLSVSLADEYLGDVDRGNFDAITPGMIDLCSVMFFKAGAYEYAKLHSHYNMFSSIKTFYYTFDYQSDDSIFSFFFPSSDDDIPFDHGVTHADELMYIFSLPADLDEKQLKVKDQMVELWTNFATYGDPTPNENNLWQELDIAKWDEFDLDNQTYMIMEDSFHIGHDFTKRWKINTMNNSNTGSSTSSSSSTTSSTTTMSQAQCDKLKDENDDLEKESTIYMSLMIVFIVFFVGACGYIIYLHKK